MIWKYLTQYQGKNSQYKFSAMINNHLVATNFFDTKRVSSISIYHRIFHLACYKALLAGEENPNMTLLWCNSVTPKLNESEEFVCFDISWTHLAIIVCFVICRSRRRCRRGNENIRCYHNEKANDDSHRLNNINLFVKYLTLDVFYLHIPYIFWFIFIDKHIETSQNKMKWLFDKILSTFFR